MSSSWQRLGTLGLLTLCYTLGELGHFLIATTSKQVANSLQFGDLRCYVDHKVQHLPNVTNDMCMSVKTQVDTLLSPLIMMPGLLYRLGVRQWVAVSGASQARAGSTRCWRGRASS